MSRYSKLQLLIQIDQGRARSRIQAAYRSAGSLKGAAVRLSVTAPQLAGYCLHLRLDPAEENAPARRERPRRQRRPRAAAPCAGCLDVDGSAEPEGSARRT